MHFADPVDDRLVLGLLGAEHRVVQILTDDLLVGGDLNYVHSVDITEFLFLSPCGTGHTCKLVIHPEVVLEGDGREGLGLGSDLHAFLGFDSLVKAVGVTSSVHQTSGEFIYYDDLAVLDDVVYIPLHHGVSLQGVQHVMVVFHALGISEVVKVEISLSLGHALFCEHDLLVLLVHGIVFVEFQILYELVSFRIKVCGIVASSGDDERGPGFIDQDGVDLVDDGEVEFPLDQVLFIDRHVVAKVIETEFVVRTVGDVAFIRGFSLGVVQRVDHTAYGEPQPCVDLAHPVSVTLGQIVVYSYYVNAFSLKCVQIYRKGSHEGLSFTGLHLGDPSLMDRDTADDLHPVVLHIENSPCSLPAYRKGIRKDIVESLAVCQTLLEFRRHGSQLVVIHGLILPLKCQDFVGDLIELFYFFRINVPKNFFK